MAYYGSPYSTTSASSPGCGEIPPVQPEAPTFQGPANPVAGMPFSQPTPGVSRGSHPQMHYNMNPLGYTTTPANSQYLLPTAPHEVYNGGPSELWEPNLQEQNSPRPVLECKWEGCTYTGQFARIPDLLRHIRHLHLETRLYSCPMHPHCRRFNRKDNLVSHMRRVHGVDV